MEEHVKAHTFASYYYLRCSVQHLHEACFEQRCLFTRLLLVHGVSVCYCLHYRFFSPSAVRDLLEIAVSTKLDRSKPSSLSEYIDASQETVTWRPEVGDYWVNIGSLESLTPVNVADVRVNIQE